MRCEDFVSLLESRGCNPRRGRNSWSARCPAHDDRDPSLTVSEGEGGRVLVHCHAGCAVDAICQSLGVAVRDLMPELTLDSVISGQSHFPRLEDAIAAYGFGQPSKYWTYTDRSGRVVGAVARWDRSDGKVIRPFTLNGKGWIREGMPSPRPLLGLAEALRADPTVPIVIVEGEKTYDAAIRCGLVAVTSAGGAQAAAKSDWSPLAGRRVIILPDNDDAGKRYADDVARLCKASDIRILHLANYAPSLPVGGDLADVLASENWCGAPIAEGASEADLGKMILDWASHSPSTATRNLRAPYYAEIAESHVSWLWPFRIPLGHVSLLAGRPGVGKSYLSLDIAARVSRGRAWPDQGVIGESDIGVEPVGSVILVAAEDDPGSVIRQRLVASGADLTRIRNYEGIVGPEGVPMIDEILRDISSLDNLIADTPGCRLVIFDPIGAYMTARDTNAESEVRGAIQPLVALARERNIAIVIVAHHNKMTATTADGAVMGSSAYVAVSRAVWHVYRDPEDNDFRLMVPGKQSFGGCKSGLRFQIGGNGITWSAEPVEKHADDVAAEIAAALSARATRRREVGQDMRQYLADGPKPAREVEDRLRARGYSLRTIRRAKEELGVESIKEASGQWVWSLPA